METKLPFVSIIVPVYNGATTIVHCVESLLAQDYPQDCFEIIVVDNASKDRTVELLQPYAQSGKIKLLSETQVLNAYGARNTGARAAKGEIFAFTDADCQAEKNWLKELVEEFADATIGCVAGEVLPTMARNTIEKYWGQEFLSQRGREGKSSLRVLGANCAYRQQVFRAVGFFRQDIPSGGDTELAYRMVRSSNYGVRLNLNAVVRHRNVSTLSSMLKQYIRYGTATYLDAEMRLNTVPPSFARALSTAFIYSASFAKHAVLVFAKRVPASVPTNDQDIYLWRPCFHILNVWATYLGFKLASRRPELYR